jgi:hypothetical protein
MKVTITGFHQDKEAYWVADLSCGHTRHFRHNPPWQVREWVTTQAGRNELLGTELDCKECDGSPSPQLPPE